ncbi:MAG: flavodoxin family protein [Promethearchaeota archaeon]
MDIKIVGVNGSPRPKHSTEILLDEALEAAKNTGGVNIEKINLYQYKLKSCRGCFKCFDPIELLKHPENLCQVNIRDDGDTLLKKLYEADGLIIGSPVYFGNVSGHMKTFFDRTEPMMRYTYTPWTAGLQNCVGGAIVAAGNRHGGVETTIRAIHNFFLIHDMIIVGTGSHDISVYGFPVPGCYYGGAGWMTTTDTLKKMLDMESIIEAYAFAKSKDIIKEDPMATMMAKSLGSRVAEVAKRIHSNSPQRLRLKLSNEDRTQLWRLA